MSHETHFIGKGMFHELDGKLQEFLEKRADPEVNGRYELILSNEWASNDCQLDGVAGSPLEKAIENHQNATALLMSRPEPVVQGLSLIKDIHSMMMDGLSDEAGQFRIGGIVPLSVGHQPPEADGIEAAMGRLLEWVSADSFLELHPVQQAALVLVRLLDIYPFADGTPRTCRVMANSGLIRAGFPPAIFYFGEASLYKQAIEAGLAMDTTRLTTRIAASLARTLEYCLTGTLKSAVT
ncbi:MAG: Fic family protein [Acidobacteriia bacterium]|nr:Fic family protein [Terriglobia bacterium]